MLGVGLHGTAGNEAIFRVQLGPLVRVLREMADLYFIEGSIVVGEDNEQAAIIRQFFGDDHTLYEYARPTTDERQWRTYAALSPRFAQGFAFLQQVTDQSPVRRHEIDEAFRQEAHQGSARPAA